MATPVRKTTEREKHPPTYSRDVHSQSVKQKHACIHRTGARHTHSVETVAGLLSSAFDLLQLWVALERGSRVSASIYALFTFDNNTACSNKERNAALTGQG